MNTNGSLDNFWGSSNHGTQGTQVMQAKAPYVQQPMTYDNYYDQQPISIGGWILIFLVLSIPLVNIVMLIYWATKDTNLARKSFARASLFWMLVVITVTLVLMVVLYDKLNYAVIFDKYLKSFRTFIKLITKK